MKNNKFFLIFFSFILLFFVSDFCIDKVLLNGLTKYYGLGQNSKIALVGHSHLMLGVDKEKIEDELNIRVSKYTREGVSIKGRNVMIQHLLRTNDSIKTIIYGVDAWSFTTYGLSSNSQSLFYPFLKDSIINDYTRNNSSFSDYWTKKIIRTSRYDELLISSSVRGYLGKWSNLKFGTLDVEQLKNEIANGDYRRIQTTDDNVEILRNTIEDLSKKNIRVILFYVPTTNLLTDIQTKNYEKTILQFEKFSEAFSNVEFLNLQEPWSKKYELFYDGIHLNPEGQLLITKELIDYLKSRNY